MALFGSVTALWEGFNLIKAIDQSEASKSPLGKELRYLSRMINLNIQTSFQNSGA